MFGADKRYLSISIQDTLIKVAQVKSSGTVEKVARATALNATPDELSKTLKQLLNGLDRKASVVCVIPASMATSKGIEVPSSDTKEIRSILNLQASRHTPYSREEVLIGHINLGTVTTGNTKILLVIAHRNVVKERFAVLEKCGLNPEKILFVPEGIGRLYTKGLNLKNNAPLGLIDFSINAVNFLIIARGSVVFSRSIAFGIKQLTEAEASSKIIDELTKSLAAYQSEESQAVGSFVLTSDNAFVKDFLPRLQEALKVDVRVSPYINLIKAAAVKNKLQKDFSDDSFLDVIASGISSPKAEVNFMPDEMVIKRTVEKESAEATKAGVAVVVIMVLIGLILMSKIYFKDEFLNKKLKEQYAEQKEEVKQLQERMAKTRIIREYMQGRTIGLDVMNELYRVTPNAIYLTSITFEEDGGLTLVGVAPTMPEIFSYEKSLSKSNKFEEVKTKSSSIKKDGAKETAVFEITLKYKEAS